MFDVRIFSVTMLSLMFQEKFEIAVVMEGTVESTGMTCQLRTSYLPSEIIWGHTLSPLVTYQKTDGHYKINYSDFHTTIPIEPPMSEISARKLHERRQSRELDRSDSNNNPDVDMHMLTQYPVTFTAPTGGHRSSRRPWLRKPSLKGSLRRRGDGKPRSPQLAPSNGSKFANTSPSGASSVKGTPSLQSVNERRDISGFVGSQTPSPEHRLSPHHYSAMKRSTSSPEHATLPEVPEQKPVTAFIGNL